MRVAIISKFGSPDVFRVEERDIPTPKSGQLLIEVAYAGVNYFDVLQRQGRVPGTQTPVVPGLEVSGVVAAVGDGVAGFEVGQRVIAIPGGGYAEYVAVDAAQALAIDDAAGLDLATCACLPVTAVTAYQVLADVARLRASDTVLVNGATGGVGSLLAPIARALGSTRIIGVVGSGEKVQMAREAGYTEVLVRDSYLEQIATSPAGQGVDVVVEMGGGDSVPGSMLRLSPLGRLVYMGDPAFSTEATVALQQLRSGNLGVLGYSVGNLRRVRPDLWRAGARAVVDLVSSRRLVVRPASIFSLSQAAEAHIALEARRSPGKLLLQMK